MRALAAELAERGIVVTHDTVWRFVRSQGLSFKKRLLDAANGIGLKAAC